MSYKKIHIIGGPGSGKTYLGKKLSQNLKIKHMDLDDLHWNNSPDNYDIKRNTQERNQKLTNILKNNSWIIEGVYYKWTENSFNQSDLIIILKPHALICNLRIIKRFIWKKLKFIKNKKKETLKETIKLLKWSYKYKKEISFFYKNFKKKYNYKIIESTSADKIFDKISKNIL